MISIEEYLSQKPKFTDLWQQHPPTSSTNLNSTSQVPSTTKTMPSHPAEENATGSITDQVAKESKDSTASTHGMHQVDTGATSGGSQGKATAQDHSAAPGPVMAESLGEPASKDDLKKRAAELNK